jgi:hypothetical protein
MKPTITILFLASFAACSAGDGLTGPRGQGFEPDGEDEPGSVDGGKTGKGNKDGGGAGIDGGGDGAAPSGDGGFTRGPSAVITPQSGPNTVDLGVANAAFAGAKLTFDVVLTAGAPGSVAISNIFIDNATASGLRLYRPTWVVEDDKEAMIAVAADTTVDMQIPARRKSPYAKISVLIPDYRAGLRLRVIFGALAPATTTAITGLPPAVYEECKAPQLFAPAVSRHWNQTGCRNCHSGLFSFELMGSDNATACGLNKRLIRAGGPNLARPTQGAHAGGLMPEANAYTSALTSWRNAEQ